MVFSLFSRKDKPDGRKGRDPGSSRSPSPDSTVRGPNGVDAAQTQRELARRTAEKIDQIESEMIAAALPVPPPPRRIQERAAPAGLPPLPFTSSEPRKPADASPAFGQAGYQAGVPIERDTTVVLGDTAAAGEIHVAGSHLPPQLEEAAILFANGQPQPAMATLRNAIAHGEVADAAQQAWLMLFDIMNHCGMRTEFDNTAIDFASVFEKSPPPWREQATVPAPAARPAGNGAALALPPVVDESIGRLTEQARRAAAAKRPVTVDCRAVQQVDAAGAALLCGLLDVFKQSRAPLVVAEANRLFEVARAGVEPGRRDDSEAVWMLALESLRVLGERQQFDDLAIDYCVTFEVSPPSWEPMPEAIRSRPADPAPATQTPAAGEADAGSFALRGELTGRMQKELAALRAGAHARSEVVIDCRELDRLDFVAAGELLNELVMLRARNAPVVFVEPSYVVLALMIVMGIHDLAQIRRRRI